MVEIQPALYAAVDMGTHSFKLLIATRTPNHPFLLLPILRFTSQVLLPSTSSLIPPAALLRATSALRNFHTVLASHNVPPSHTRHVATSAVRLAPNQSQFLRTLEETSHFKIDVLLPQDEARLTYVGVLQSHAVYETKSLVVDIGGGSTEFVVGKGGEVLYGISLLLGHVTLTQEFAESNRIVEMREHIRGVVRESGLVEGLGKNGGFQVVIGSSGTIRAIEKAVCEGFGKEMDMDHMVNGLSLLGKGYKRDWKFSRGELNGLVRRLCRDDGALEREKMFKERSELIVAGAVLLEEIFEILKIESMEVSRYSLCEGVIAEKLAGTSGNSALDANARWRSVIRLASRFNSNKKLRSAALSVFIAKEMFECVRKWHRLGVSFGDNDLEYLEAACLLHSIGAITGKKGYHKRSYHIIMNGGHLYGYDLDEIKIVALLCRHHRKKFPKMDHHSLQGLTKELKQKFMILCAILRVSIVLQQFVAIDIQDIKAMHSQEGFKLVLGEISYEPFIPGDTQNSPEDVDREIAEVLEIFYKVFNQKLTVIVPSSSLESLKRVAFADDNTAPQL